MNESMNAWLRSYEARRTGGNMSAKGLLSSRFDLEGLSWSEIREIPLPELGENMTFGKGCEQLRKTWRHLKLNRSEGTYHNIDLELRINRLQHFLGFERTQFDDLDPDWVDQELSMEEEKSNEASDDLNGQELSEQLRREEFQDQLNAWGLDDGEERLLTI
jgi:hypothetical protein